MQLSKSLVLTTGLAALVLTGNALAHCGSCGVGGAKKKAHAHGHDHDHAHDHAHEPAKKAKAKAKAKGWMDGAKKAGAKKGMIKKAGGVAIGQTAPDFNLVDHNGNPVKLADFAGKAVVLEWTNPGCPYVVRHYGEGTMKKLQKKWANHDVQWLTINSTHTMGKDENAAFATEHDLSWPVLSDSSGRVGRLYGAKTTPHMFVIDKDGKLAYSGAIDDDPQGEKDNRKMYVHKALLALKDGASVPTAQTKPYGCSVKYPN
jgi:peroxiredoxin